MTPSTDDRAPRLPFEALLLDFDGTVVDTTPLILASYRHTMTIHHGAAPPDEVWMAGMGTPLRKQLRALATSDDEADAMADTYRQHSKDHHDALARTFDGMRECLEALYGLIPIGLVTSKGRPGVIRSFKAFDLAGFFDVVISADDVTEHKPAPTPVRTAAQGLSVVPEKCLMVGDSPHDIHAGQAAGAATAAAAWGVLDEERVRAANPDYWLDSPKALTHLILNKSA